MRVTYCLVVAVQCFAGVANAADVPPAAPVSAAPQGVLPKAADGRSLNLDFETGDLRDWVASGSAFAGQPIKGDTVFARRNDSHSEHAGAYWIGGFEKHQDPPQGELTSAAFVVTHPFAAFLVGGGPHDTTCVELVRQDTQQVFLRVSGAERENLRPVVVDLKDHQGKKIFIRLVDRHSGHWGHVNFDDFRFYETRPAFSQLAPLAVADQFTHAGLSPDDAARAMQVPEGFRVTAFAGEPDVLQPIAMALDDRGRLWVAEAFSYPNKVPVDQAKDQIVIFEDSNGDGRFDKRTVFADKLNLVSGLELGFGGVFVGAAPELLFIPDQNGDDKPDGPPQVLLDGWGYHDTHETLNSFIWGPDGWLYGCHGVFTHSLVGKPGMPREQRTPLNAGIWRFHPLRQEFEVFAYGTSNPWGVDFNDRGDAFLTCCVIPHLFHVIQGARYQRQAGEHFQPYTYADIPTIAQHRHWVGNQWNDADRARSGANGGGHAHAGAMIYLGHAWPEKYRNQLFMNNIHGARLNLDLLQTAGSGYTGDGAPDFLLTNDRWSQILNLQYGPDGQVFMIDWYDNNQCHHGNAAGHDRSNGRIFKVTYGNGVPVISGLSTAVDSDLVALQFHRNDWYVRHARRLLQERAAAGKLAAVTHAQLRQFAFHTGTGGPPPSLVAASPQEFIADTDDVSRRLRCLWALHVTGGLTEAAVRLGLADREPLIRGWTIQLAVETVPPTDAVVAIFAEMAENDASPVVRRYLASAMQRLPVERRWLVMAGLLNHAEDVADHNLPLLDWYAAEPLAAADARRALETTAAGKIPQVQSFMIRRIGSSGTPQALALLIEFLNRAGDAAGQRLYLDGMAAALSGRRRAAMPDNWPAAAARLRGSSDALVRAQTQALAVTFGDPEALAQVRQVLTNPQAGPGERKAALAALLGVHDDQLAPVLQMLIADPALRGEALRGLAAYDDPKTPRAILAGYARYTPAERRDALNTLASRPAFARELLTAVGEKQVPAADLTADLLRQMRNLKDAAIQKQIGEVWGVVRDTPEEKNKLISRYKALVAARPSPADDLPLGRAVFAKTCQQCHTLFGVGNKIGPELTGSNRANIDYLLSNVIDPSAVLGKDYIPFVVSTTGGRIVTGLLREQNANAVTIVTANETIVIPRNEIDEMLASNQSMMPDNLLQTLKDDEVRALVAYLASPQQAPLPATEDNVKTFFNGRDLAGWEGNPSLWKVDNGELVGVSPGLKQNEFLRGQLLVGDFRLSCDVKLTPDAGNSGIQFRSEALAGGEVRGYQADVGAGWWGKLYEELGRGLLWDKSGEAYVKPGEWNHYEISAVGSRVRTFINGRPCVDLDDPPGAKRGVFALQLHAGGPFEVRYKNLRLELLPTP